MREPDPDRFSARQWPDWSFWTDPRGGGSGVHRGRVRSVVVNGLMMGFLATWVIAIADGRYGPVRTGLVFGFLGCYAVAYLLVLWFGPLALRRQRIAMVAAMFALGATPALILGSPAYLTGLTYAIATGLMLLPLRISLLLGAGAAVAQIAWMIVRDGVVAWGQVLTLVAVTAILGIVYALTFTIGHLRLAREQIRRMAVDQERQRVARDLHDVLGHSLSTMTLKLGLTRRILETSDNTDAALAEIRDLDDLCREALSDVRATVSDYRTVSFATEVAGARMALRAAGVHAELPAAADAVAPELQGVFGYVVREAVTNVLRHSDAQRCVVRVGRDWLEVADDGTVPAEVVPGHGLTGLAERMSAVSGSLEHGRGPHGGFRVLARGPATGGAA
ncbi:histidine kinase [Amycolatopsis sp. FU40]|uniref:sensor histidine kinase n=1 Tax=Amycolatopsis sp. FU40 TaxID=2914159 RepID=UPI001F00A61F|nr:histidine kinase [Amycolatopsis sp. FU40]UKD57751.1 histidine kinase [Amycolatopsis sp. FU40]